MTSISGTIKKVRRPTEERALSAIQREALRLGITQFELLNRLRKRNADGKSHQRCNCMYCRRKRLIVENPAAEVFA